MYAVETNSLSRTFKAKGKPIVALKNVDLNINYGEILGLLGANGAGKTTFVKILATLLLPSEGKASVYGFDVTKQAKQIRKIINLVSGGETPGYGILTVRENLWFFSQLYGLSNKLAKERVQQLIKDMELEEYVETRMHKLSTGFKQRLNLARGFINDPKVLFLDEPTLGLDIINAKHIRNYVKDWVRSDKSRAVLLTTHYMAEAEEICDKIAIIYNGSIVACETPQTLKSSMEKSTVVRIEVKNSSSLSFENVSGIIASSIDSNSNSITKIKVVLDDESRIPLLVSHLADNGCKIMSINTSEPSLEDVYLKYVGRGISTDGYSK
ncbi:MAG: ABC-2 type transport system ATP-binding protein [Candidatus Nitrosomirales archaeon]|jgi:ABC-2 type transport system ATP-binding protein